MKRQIYLLFSLFWLIVPDLVYGQQYSEEWSVQTQGSNITSQFTSQNPYYGLPGYDMNKYLLVKLDLGDDFLLGEQLFSVKYSIDVSYGGTSVAQGLTLLIDESNPEAVLKIPFNTMSTMQNTSIDLVANLVSVQYPGLYSQSIFNSKIRLSVAYEREYFVDVNPATLQLHTVSFPSTKEVEFSWNPTNVNQCPNYQFQLLKLYNVSTFNQNNPNVVTANIDWSEALTLEMQSSVTSLKLTMAEGTGFYLWRVRPVGTYYGEGIANAANWGQWQTGNNFVNSVTLNNGALPGSSVSGSVASLPYSSVGGGYLKGAFFYFDPDEDKNWIYSRVFTEEGKMSESISYATYLQHVRQTQIHIQSKDTTMITQSYTDKSGRSAFSTLPVPKPGGFVGYQSGFVKNSFGQLYSNKDFDDDNKLYDPSMIQYSGSYEYYSSLSGENIPDAEGYPFSRNLYYNDGSNRVKEQSMPGKVHSLGEQSNGKGHTVKTMYGTASDDELIAVFGDEAPAGSSVLKTVTIDQNNVGSITYTNKFGKVIAMSLSFSEAATNMLNVSDDVINISDTLRFNTETENGFVTGKKVVLVEPSPISVDYFFPCNTIQLPCPGGEANCEYFVRLDIINVDDPNDPATNFTVTYDLSTIPCNSDGEKHCSLNTGGNTFPSGSYMVQKTLYSTGDFQNQLNIVYTDFEDEMVKYLTVLDIWLNDIDSQEDWEDFYQKIDDFENSIMVMPEYQTLFGGNPNNIDINFFNPWIKISSNNVVQDSLILETQCCGRLAYPIGLDKYDACAENPIDFEGYFIDQLVEQNEISEQDAITEVGNYFQSLGYAQGEFNLMIEHMINDVYACGVSQNGIDQNNAAVQYECDDLFKCWAHAVQMYIVTRGMDPITIDIPGDIND